MYGLEQCRVIITFVDLTSGLCLKLEALTPSIDCKSSLSKGLKMHMPMRKRDLQSAVAAPAVDTCTNFRLHCNRPDTPGVSCTRVKYLSQADQGGVVISDTWPRRFDVACRGIPLALKLTANNQCTLPWAHVKLR